MDSKDLIHLDKSIIDKDALEINGKKIYHENDFMQKLSNLMEHPEYKDFLCEHFDSWLTNCYPIL